MKAFAIYCAKSFAALLVVVLVLGLAQQWDATETARVRAGMTRGA